MHAILFDIGNVLVCYNHTQTMEAMASLYCATPPHLHALYAKIGGRFGLGEVTPVQVCHFLNEQLGVDINLEQFEQAFCAGLARNDTALAYAASLQVEDELFVGAISNTNVMHVGWLDVNVPELNGFELVIMSNEVGLLKPDPEIFELALELLDTPASHVLYIDDSAENSAAAQLLGMESFIHVDWIQTRSQIEAWCDGWRDVPTPT